MSLTSAREKLVAATSLRGQTFTRALSEAADRWLAGLFEEATHGAPGLTLVATGGYGRAELYPASDLDLLLLHRPDVDADAVAEKLWYPIWDDGVKLGHGVGTVDEALALAAARLDTATALIETRRIAGDADLHEELRARVAAWWRDDADVQLPRLADAVDHRQQGAGEVAFLLEPDLKAGRGGLRDIQALRGADTAYPVLDAEDRRTLDTAQRVLCELRVEVHRVTGRASDLLLLEDQDAVADALDYADADAMVAELATNARAVAWVSDETWRRARRHAAPPTAWRDRPVADGVMLRDGAVHVVGDPVEDPAVALRAAAAAARAGTNIDRRSLDLLAARLPPYPDPWPNDARHRLVDLLGSGRRAVRVLEALDHVGVLTRILPEWEPVRSRPQRNAYHRFTVDRHLHEAAVEAAKLKHRVGRPDLLLVGCWLHDLGKGYPGDHTEVGVELLQRIGPRMGFPPADVAVLCDLVRHHLLLPDVATRRDLGDDATLRSVAAAVGDRSRLSLLAALTEADSLATGPSAWGSWKASLVELLVERVDRLLAGRELDLEQRLTEDQRRLLAQGPTAVAGRDDVLTVVATDAPGVFSRIAGALAISAVDVLEASARSEAEAALSIYRVEVSPDRSLDWDQVCENVRRALQGRLALAARIAEREHHYRSRLPAAAAAPQTVVTVSNDESEDASIVEVRTVDRTGVLYRITKALAELDLDIRHAKVQTLGHEVVDSFYVTAAATGAKLDEDHSAEVVLALRYALGS